VILGLCVFAYTTLTDIEKAPAKGDQRVIDVYGQQFTWTFNYDEQGKKFTSSQLYLPAQSEVKFRIHSRDVIHDFWVPDWRMKIDAVPGITTSYRVNLKPGALGEHDIVCAELCGLGHAYMRQTAHVLSKGAFGRWVQRMTTRQTGGGGGGTAGAAPDGKQLFTAGDADTGATACGSCHTLADAGTTATTGPDLDKGLKGKDPAFIKQSILQPSAEITKGYQDGIMPNNFGDTLSPEQVDALVQYLAKVTNK
jgi:cytochrome c oxidase subunit II